MGEKITENSITFATTSSAAEANFICGTGDEGCLARLGLQLLLGQKQLCLFLPFLEALNRRRQAGNVLHRHSRRLRYRDVVRRFRARDGIWKYVVLPCHLEINSWVVLHEGPVALIAHLSAEGVECVERQRWFVASVGLCHVGLDADN